MDSKDKLVKPARPVLFDAGGPSGETRDAQRITAALETDPDSAESRRWRGFAFRPVVVVLACVLAAAAVWMAWPDRQERNEQALAVATATPADPAAAGASTAVLVTDVDDPMSIIRAKAAANGDPTQSSDADALAAEPIDGQPPSIDQGSDVAATQTAARASNTAGAQASSPNRTRTAARRTQASDADLLQTLLANIRAQPDRAGTGKDAPQTLDDLIARLNTSSDDTVPTAANNPVAQGSAKLQTQLRACPAANTLQGINCRQKLCARHRGDPACPLK
ncbi:MAG TPA: hypothetical protein PLD19_03590 [Luteimonas sp.]|nr:hypothetical protein [Luteimonas sp.]